MGAGGGVEIVITMVIRNSEKDTHFRLRMDGRDIVFLYVQCWGDERNRRGGH